MHYNYTLTTEICLSGVVFFVASGALFGALRVLAVSSFVMITTLLAGDAGVGAGLLAAFSRTLSSLSLSALRGLLGVLATFVQ